MTLTLVLIAAVTLFVIWQVNRHMESRFWKLGLSGSILLLAMAASAIIITSTSETVLAQQQTTLNILDEAEVQSGDLTITVNATGPITPLREVTLNFQTSSVVTEVLVEEGDFVRQGDVIARLDAEEVLENLEDAQFGYERNLVAFEDLIDEPREVDLIAAENAYKAAQLSLGGSAVLAGPGSTQARIEELEAELARNQLWQAQISRDNAFEGVVSASVNLETAIESPFIGNEGEDNARDQLWDSLTNLILAEGGVYSAEGSVTTADAQLEAELARSPEYGGVGGAATTREQAEIDLENLLNGGDGIDIARSRNELALSQVAIAQIEDSLEDTVLVAPFDGVVVTNNLSVGEVPQPGAVVLTDSSQLYVDLQIDEVDVASIRVDQQVVLDVDALPGQEISGVVERVYLTPELVDQVVTYKTRILLNETDAPIRLGMSTTAQVAVRNVNDVTLIPNRFIQFDEGEQVTFVTVQDDEGNLLNVPVEIGVRSDTTSEVVSGVAPGQRIVLLPRESRTQVAFAEE